MASDVPWFPMIYSDKCDGCIKTGKPRCIEFCPNRVFEFEDGKAIVAHPVNCGGDCTTVRCSACAPLCHKRAIVFPSGSTRCSQLKGEDKDMLRKTTCKACSKQYWTNSEDDICFDCEEKE